MPIQNQVRKMTGTYTEDGRTFEVRAKLRFDDQCKNGHNTFSITADVYILDNYDRYKYISGGCCHEDFAKAFPQYKHLIKWHLCGSDQPMHYIANTIYHAGDRDCYGLRKGEFKQIINGRTGLPAWKLKIPSHASAYVDAAEKPESIVCEYEPFGRTGEGKERNLEAARSCAIWPEATDEELCSDDLEQKLKDRHPQLMKDFRKDMEDFGFVW